MARYQKPNWFLAKIANPAVRFVIRRLGMSPAGAHVLEVRGRKSGKVQTVPVNPIEVDGHRYLFAPRGPVGSQLPGGGRGRVARG